jgi:purine-binding chemotaxis protein CheW
MTAPQTPRRALTSREILEERARALARPTASATGADETFVVEMLSFRLGRERFAIESQHVFAVFRLLELVPLPGARPPVVGITRWRGDVLTLLDLRRLVGVAPGALDDLGRVLVIGHTAPEFGILADIVDDIISIDPAALHVLSGERAANATTIVKGVTGDAIHVLDAAALIARQTETSLQASAVSQSPLDPPQ